MPPGFSLAIPKLRQMDLAWPIWRCPFGSGGNRVTTRPPYLPALRSAATISRMKSEGLNGAGVVMKSRLRWIAGPPYAVNAARQFYHRQAEGRNGEGVRKT